MDQCTKHEFCGLLNNLEIRSEPSTNPHIQYLTNSMFETNDEHALMSQPRKQAIQALYIDYRMCYREVLFFFFTMILHMVYIGTMVLVLVHHKIHTWSGWVFSGLLFIHALSVIGFYVYAKIFSMAYITRYVRRKRIQVFILVINLLLCLACVGVFIQGWSAWDNEFYIVCGYGLSVLCFWALWYGWVHSMKTRAEHECYDVYSSYY